MKSKKSLIILSLFLLLIVLNNCSQIDNDSGTSTVTIPLIGNNANNSLARAPSVTDIASFTLTVTGSGMGTITETYPASTQTIELEVPSGNNREFSLVVDMDPDSSSAVLSWLGTTEVDLEPNATENIILNMEISETKIIIPDNLNSRVVIMNDMSGTPWTEYTGGLNNPYDVDMDSTGRIYIANYDAGLRIVRRIDDITGSNPIDITGVSGTGVYSIAVDKNNDLLYYADWEGAALTELYRSDLDGNGPIQIDTSTYNIQYIRGMDVDDNGVLYIAGSLFGGPVQIFRYDIIGPSVTQYGGANLNFPWDVLVKDGFLYVANFGTTGDPPLDHKIIQFTLNLTPVTELPGGGGDDFYGPHRFVAILNRKINIVDDGRVDLVNFNIDRIVSIEDINGTAWETYGSVGTGTGEFQFFQQYFC